ncbi:MAG: D-alanyl-D-alanine carboxypeptidase/D-alanyl-D-alanine-endopeptidase [Solirubrobacterales bacterium]
MRVSARLGLALVPIVTILSAVAPLPAAAAAGPPRPLPNPDRPAATPIAPAGGTAPGTLPGATASRLFSRGTAPRALPGATASRRSAGPDRCRTLRRRLHRGGGTPAGLLVAEAGDGSVLCSSDARRRRPLASNMKLFTTSTALSRFGPGRRLPTRLLASGRLGRTGVLHGDLYLKGGGDPALGSPAFFDAFLGGLGTDIYGLTRRLRAAGVRSVTGRLYADASIFDRRRGVADSGYATSPYIGPLSGLGFNSGFADSGARSFASDPARLAADKLARSLRRHGVRVKRRVALGEAPKGARVLAFVRSPRMERLVNETDVESNNYFAEMLIKGLGARFGKGGSTFAGARVVEAFARRHGSAVHAVDGSGLTRTNRASPAEMVGLLRAMHSGPLGSTFEHAMALAGREGTVADRMRGTAAEGRCRTKTGTLSGVSNLSGYCFNRSGRVVVFSILMAGVRDLALAHLEQDRMAGVIAGY